MLEGKTALVTGSTSGIGLGIARKLAGQKANIVLNGFGEQAEIEKIQKEFSDIYKVKTIFCPADISRPEDIKKMFQDIEKNFGGVDILVNNAGIQYVAPIEEFPDEKWNAIIATNLSSCFFTIKNALPHMRKKNWGRIINIASAHGLVGSAQKSAYVAAKHGVMGLTKVTALETAETFITCNSICPGFVLTPLVQKQIEAKAVGGKTIEQASHDLLFEKQPSLRFVKIDDIAEFVVFLSSEAGGSVTGSNQSIDGGWTAR